MVIPFFLCAAISAGLVYFQYFYRSEKFPAKWVMSILRFIGIFVICFLVFGPKIEKEEFVITKQPLVFLYDNSASIDQKSLQNDILRVRDYFNGETDLEKRFGIFRYSFGASLNRNDSLLFNEEISDLHGAIEAVNKSYPKEKPVVVLVSDGNQTGRRHYANQNYSRTRIFPIVVGDTSRIQDIQINQVNLNRFTFSGNQYPIEILYSYYTNEPIKTEILLRDNGNLVMRQVLQLEKGYKSGSLSVNVLAKQPGLHELSTQIIPLPNEKNTKNNSLSAAIEVVDERFKIGVISNSSHPDIGALKRSIESNQQREFKFFSPKEAINSSWDADILVFIDPDSSFETVFTSSAFNRIPHLILAGSRTDWDYLNQLQKDYKFDKSDFTEYFIPEWNPDFSFYQFSYSDVMDFPPLEGSMGNLLVSAENQSVLFKNIGGLKTTQPLISLIKSDVRKGLILGKGLWKWRLENYRQRGNFEFFDDFISKIFLFLSEKGKPGRLSLEYKPIFDNPSSATIRVRYFDESLNFDPNKEVLLELIDSTGANLPRIRLTPTKRYYEADLRHLPPGLFQFKMRVSGTDFNESGSFKIQPFRLEALSSGSDGKHLNELAMNNFGKLYLPDQVEALKDTLLKSDEFRPIQKNNMKVVSLIDIKWLLGILFLAFSVEWIIRKYHGLI